jgi:hypothetical protein
LLTASATQPPTPRVTFVENPGLALVVPMDYVKQVADQLMKNVPLTAEAKQTVKTVEPEDSVVAPLPQPPREA